MGVATASATFFRKMGGTLGVAVFLSILFSTASGRIADAFRTIAVTPEFQSALADPAVRSNPANAAVLQTIRAGGAGGVGNASGVLQDSSFLQHIDQRLARPFLVGFSNAMDEVFLVAAGVLFIVFVLLLFLEEIPLRTQSGIEALAAELAAETSRSSANPAPDDSEWKNDEPAPILATSPATGNHGDVFGQGRAPARSSLATAGRSHTRWSPSSTAPARSRPALRCVTTASSPWLGWVRAATP
jgi:hypothetical protein